MSRLLQIQDQILDVVQRASRIERALAEQPSRALSSSLKSLYKLRDGLESEFREAASADQVDVVSYRLFEGRERPTMTLVGRAMESFQTLYAILYSAIANHRPMDRARLSSAVIEQSAFEFSYAYSGSVGFVFTMPNQRLLFGETMLDQAMETLFAMARSSNPDEIKSFARRFGFAPVRAIYQWAEALCASGVGADIEWKKGRIEERFAYASTARIGGTEGIDCNDQRT